MLEGEPMTGVEDVVPTGRCRRCEHRGAHCPRASRDPVAAGRRRVPGRAPGARLTRLAPLVALPFLGKRGHMPPAPPASDRVAQA